MNGTKKRRPGRRGGDPGNEDIEAFKCGLLNQRQAPEELKARGEELGVYTKVWILFSSEFSLTEKFHSDMIDTAKISEISIPRFGSCLRIIFV